MAYLLDYIKSRWAPKGSVVTAGVPPEARVEQVPVTRELVARHLAASTLLPQGEATETAIFKALSDPAVPANRPARAGAAAYRGGAQRRSGATGETAYRADSGGYPAHVY